MDSFKVHILFTGFPSCQIGNIEHECVTVLMLFMLSLVIALEIAGTLRKSNFIE